MQLEHPSARPTSGTITFQLRFNCGVLEFRGQASLLTHGRRASSAPSTWQGATSVPETVAWRSTRQHLLIDPRSLPSGVGELSAASRSRQQCGRPGRLCRKWISLSQDWANAPVATGSYQAQFRPACQRGRSSRRSGGPQPCWRWPMADATYAWRNTSVFPISPPGARRHRVMRCCTSKDR